MLEVLFAKLVKGDIVAVFVVHIQGNAKWIDATGHQFDAKSVGKGCFAGTTWACNANETDVFDVAFDFCAQLVEHVVVERFVHVDAIDVGVVFQVLVHVENVVRFATSCPSVGIFENARKSWLVVENGDFATGLVTGILNNHTIAIHKHFEQL